MVQRNTKHEQIRTQVKLEYTLIKVPNTNVYRKGNVLPKIVNDKIISNCLKITFH